MTSWNKGVPIERELTACNYPVLTHHFPWQSFVVNLVTLLGGFLFRNTYLNYVPFDTVAQISNSVAGYILGEVTKITREKVFVWMQNLLEKSGSPYPHHGSITFHFVWVLSYSRKRLNCRIICTNLNCVTLELRSVALLYFPNWSIFMKEYTYEGGAALEW